MIYQENTLLIVYNVYIFLDAKSKKIVQIYKENSIMAQVLPEYLSNWTTKKAEIEGVYSICNAEVQDYRYKDGQLSLVLTDNQTVCLHFYAIK